MADKIMQFEISKVMFEGSSDDLKKTKNTQPAIDYAKWGNVTKEELTKFQKTSVSNLHSSWINIPHVTQHDDANITNLLKLRNKLNKKNKCKIFWNWNVISAFFIIPRIKI